jgi:hypothetical protein
MSDSRAVPTPSPGGSSLREARAQLAALTAAACAGRDAALAARGIERHQHTATEWPVALVPRHRARVRRLSRHRQARFEARLRALIAFVHTHDASADERTLASPPPLGNEAAQLVAATCSACRGACCANGGDHAFLRTRTLRDMMAQHPALDDEGVVAAYLGWLPERTMTGGCVYQSAHGCTLPRALRSSICNAYVCGGLQRALRDVVPGETRGVYVAHRVGAAVVGGQLRALPVLTPDG